MNKPVTTCLPTKSRSNGLIHQQARVQIPDITGEMSYETRSNAAAARQGEATGLKEDNVEEKTEEKIIMTRKNARIICRGTTPFSVCTKL